MDAFVKEDIELIERTGELADEEVTDEDVDELIEADDDPLTDPVVADTFDEIVFEIDSTGLIFTDIASFTSFSLIDFTSFSRVSKRFKAS